MADDEGQLLSEAKQLSFSDRVAHKNWKVRSEAYDDIKTSCQRVFSDEDPALSQYCTAFSLCVAPGSFQHHSVTHCGLHRWPVCKRCGRHERSSP